MKASRRRFTAIEYASRQQKTRNAMAEKGLQALVVSDPSNMCWLTGYDGWSFYVHQCVVLGVDGTLFWFGRGIDASGARLTTDLPADDIIEYRDEYVQSETLHPMQVLAEALKNRGLHSGSIGLEKDNYYFSARAAESLYAALPEAQFSDATALVNWQRAVKSVQEIEYMRRAGEIIEQVYTRVLEVAEPGMRKNALVAEIFHAATLGTEEHYGDYAAIVPLIGAGSEAAACHMTWDGEALQADSGMFLELAGAYARYHCPCSRTLYLGEPPDKYRRIEAALQACFDAVLPLFKPGVSCGEVAAQFFDTLNRLGYEKSNRCGYPIGLSYPPDWGERTMSLRRSDTTLLEAGMTFHFMPGIWFDDWGFELTESVLVTDNGGEYLSNVPRQLLVKN